MTGQNNKYLYLLKWLIEVGIWRRERPILASLVLTDRCNLHCQYCSVSHLGYPEMDRKAIQSELRLLYDKGARMLVITGGEPFIWHDGDFRVEDVIRWARQIGFFHVGVCTNGTFQLSSSADSLLVSLDGQEEAHETLRRSSYKRLLSNIKMSKHPRLFVDFTLTSQSHVHFDLSFRKIIHEAPNIRGVFFRFFTPYIGANQDFLLSQTQRDHVLKKLLTLKVKYPIKVANTWDGLRAWQKGNWSYPIKSAIVANQGHHQICCCRQGIADQTTCENCGETAAVEMWAVEKLKPLALLENLRYL